MKKMTDAELKEKLGDSYTAPVGLYQKTKDMPFLGSVTCNIEEMVAGSWKEKFWPGSSGRIWFLGIQICWINERVFLIREQFETFYMELGFFVYSNSAEN